MHFNKQQTYTVPIIKALLKSLHDRFWRLVLHWRTLYLVITFLQRVSIAC